MCMKATKASSVNMHTQSVNGVPSFCSLNLPIAAFISPSFKARSVILASTECSFFLNPSSRSTAWKKIICGYKCERCYVHLTMSSSRLLHCSVKHEYWARST
ncbi:unnamed protein product [Haemonchus placei]|uniref:C2H2-type domain-containing protein n=1 Tax=Haemonchus placei TaxID=6290 RepID=A0A0N4WRB4_HAEPC|nr:unnamed protein product [Haemonchus placei]